MPETGWNAADLLQPTDPSSRALEDRVFDPDPETRFLAVSLIPGAAGPVPPDLLASVLEDPSADVVLAAAMALATLRSPRACDFLSECLASRPDLAGPLALALAKLEDPGAEELLIDRLGVEDPPLRIAVIRALGSMGKERCVQELLRFLECGQPAIEREALSALTRLHERIPHAFAASEMPRSVLEEKLGHLAGSRDPAAQRTAVSLLAWLRPPEAPALLLTLLDSRDRGVRERAQEALGLIAASAERETLRAIEQAADRIPSVAAQALDRVAAVREEEGRARCLTLLAHDDPRVRERAAALAGRSGGPGATEALLSLTEDPVGHVRAQAAEALGLLRRADAGPALQALLSDSYPDVRQAALTALRSIREHEFDAAALFDSARDGSTRAAALRACDPRRTPGPFETAVSDPDASVRAACAMSLNESGAWLDGAAALLADEDPRVRSHALRARLKASDALGLGALRPFLRDPDAGVRQTFAAGLERVTGVERPAWLRLLLFDPCAAVGRSAARALARRQDQDAVGALLEAVSTAALPVAAQAIESLGTLGDAEALPRLRAVARGGDPALRELSLDAVRRIEAVRA